MTIILNNARLSFGHIAQPHQSAPNAPLKYSGDLLLDLDNPAIAELQAAALKLATEVWGDQAQTVLQYAAQESRTRSFGPGESKIKQATMQPYDGYPGKFYVTASSDVQPSIIDPQGAVIEPTDSMKIGMETKRFYSGCRVNAAVSPWPQNNQHGRCIRWNLLAVQFAADDQPFGEARPNVQGMFGAVAPQAPVASPAGVAAPMGAPSAAPPANPYGGPPPGQPVAPQGAAPAQMQPVFGPDGQWHDPQTGAIVPPPQQGMPGYPQ